MNVWQTEEIKYVSVCVNIRNPYYPDSDEWEWADDATREHGLGRYDTINEINGILELQIQPNCDDCKIDILTSDEKSYETGISGDFNGVKFQNFNWDRRDVRKSGNISVGGVTLPLVIAENLY